MNYKNEKLKIYLAGKMSGLTFDGMNHWREKLKLELLRASGISGRQIKIINPVDFYNLEEARHQSELEVEEFNLSHVVSSDIIIVNLEGLNSSDGTKIELHDANYHKRIPVIAFGDLGLYDKLHPWVKMDITRVERNMEDTIKYIKDFYLV